MAKLDVQMKFPTDAELNKMFDAVPQLERYRVSDRVVRAGAKPVVKKARQLAPRSTAEDRRKRSDKQRKEADWNYPLWKTIKLVVRKYRRARGLAVIGPEHPKGNKAYFNTGPSGNKGHHWGYPGQEYTRTRRGRTETYTAGPRKQRAQIRNWIVQAFDETRSEQVTAIKTELKKVMNEIWS